MGPGCNEHLSQLLQEGWMNLLIAWHCFRVRLASEYRKNQQMKILFLQSSLIKVDWCVTLNEMRCNSVLHAKGGALLYKQNL